MRNLRLLLNLLALALPFCAQATVYTSVVPDAPFHFISTWEDADGNNPSSITASDTFRIQEGHRISVVGDQDLRVALLESDGTLVVQGAFRANNGLIVNPEGSVQVSGNLFIPSVFTLSGTANFSQGTVTYNGTQAQNIVPAQYRFLVLEGGEKQVQSPGLVQVQEQLTQNSQLLDLGNATLRLQGTFQGGSADFSQGRVEYTGEEQDILPTAYGSLLLSGGIKTFTGNTAVGGEATFQATSALNGQTLRLGGQVTSSATPQWEEGTVIYSSTSNQNIIPTNYQTLQLQGDGDKVANGDLIIENPLTVDGAATFRIFAGSTRVPSLQVFSQAGLTLQSDSLLIEGDWLASGFCRIQGGHIFIGGNLQVDDTGVFQGTGVSQVTHEGSLTNEGSFSHTGNYTFTGTANQLISEGNVFFDILTVDKPAGFLSLGSDAVNLFANATELQQGILFLNTYTGNQLGQVSGQEGGILNVRAENAGTIQWPDGDYTRVGNSGLEFIFTSNDSYSIPPLPQKSPFPSIRIYGRGTKTLSDTINVQGFLSIENQATLNNGGHPILINGNWREVNNSSSLAGLGKVVFYDSTTAQISGGGQIRFQDWEVRDSAKVLNIASPILVEGNVLLTDSATVNQQANINWHGQIWEVSRNASLIGNASVLVFNEEQAQLQGDATLNFHNLLLQENAKLQLQQRISIANNLGLEANAVCDAQAFPINGGNALSMAENSRLILTGFDNAPKGFSQSTLNNGTIQYNRQGDQRIAGVEAIKQYHILQIDNPGGKTPTANINAFRLVLNGGDWQQGSFNLTVNERLEQQPEATFTATGGTQLVRQAWAQLGDASLQNNALRIDSLWLIGNSATANLSNNTTTIRAGLVNQGRLRAQNAELSITAGDWANEGIAQWPSGNIRINGSLLNSDSLYASNNQNTWALTGNLVNSAAFLNGNTRLSIQGNWSNSGTFNLDSSSVTLQGDWENQAGGAFEPGTSLVQFVGSSNSRLTDQDRNPNKASFHRFRIAKDSVQREVALTQGTILRASFTRWNSGTLNLGNTDAGAISQNHSLGNATALGGRNANIALELQARNNRTAQWPQGDFFSTANGQSGFLSTQQSNVVYSGGGYFLPPDAPCYRRLRMVEGANAGNGKMLSADLCVNERLILGERPNGTESPTKALFQTFTAELKGNGLQVTHSSTLNIQSDATVLIAQGNGLLSNNGLVNVGENNRPTSTGKLRIQLGNWVQESGVLRIHGTASVTLERGNALGAGQVQINDTGLFYLAQGDYLREGNTNQAGESTLELRQGNLQENAFRAREESSTIFSNTNATQRILEGGSYLFANLRLRKQGQSILLDNDISIGMGLWLNSFQVDGASPNTQGGLLEMQTSDITLLPDAVIYGKEGTPSSAPNALSSFDNAQMLAMSGTAFTGRLVVLVKENDVEGSLERVFPIGAGTASNPKNWQYNPAIFSNIVAGTEGTPRVTLAAIPYQATAPDLLQKYWEVRTEGILPISQAQVSFQYTDAEINRQGGTLEVRRFDAGEAFVVKDATINETSRQFGAPTENTFLEGDWRLGVLSQLPRTYYAYRSGNWNEPETWTQDPTGLTQSPSDIAGLKARGGGPNFGDYAFVINGHTVSIKPETDNLILGSVNLQSGILRIEEGSEGHYFGTVTGTATLQNIINPELPEANYSSFAGENGGTLALETPEGRTTTLAATQTEGQLHNLEITGKGTTRLAEGYRISGDLTVSAGRLLLQGNQEVQGNIRIATGAAMQAQGNRRLTAFQNLTINGQFVGNNKDTIRYDEGGNRLSLIFRGDKDAVVSIRGKAAFDQFQISKSPTATVTLNALASDSLVFNNALELEGEGNKALTLISGVLRLPAPIQIHSLTEGGSPFVIRENATLWIDGAEVQTSPSLDTLNTNYAWNIRGRLRLTRGLIEATAGPGLYFSDQSSQGGTGGIGGQIEVQGGSLRAKAIFTEYNQTGNNDGYGSLVQSGGEITLQGTRRNSGRFFPAATLSLPSSNSAVELSAGTLNIQGSSNGWLANIRARQENREVTGGAVNLSGTGNFRFPEVHHFTVREEAQVAVRSEQQIGGNALLQIGSQLSTSSSLAFQGNWRQQGDYRNSNITLLNGQAAQVVSGLDSAQELRIENTAGAVSWQSTTQVLGNLFIGEASVSLQGNIGVQGDFTLNGSVTGVGTVTLEQANDPQRLISENGLALIDRLTLSNNQGVWLQGNWQVERELRLAEGNLTLGTHTLTLGSASQIDDAGLGFGNNRMILAGEGQVTQSFNGSEAYLLPIGAGNTYTPVELSLNTTGNAAGKVSVLPREGLPPSIDSGMEYFWQLQRSGLEGEPISITAFYPQSKLPDATGFQAAILTDSWQVGAPNTLNADLGTLNFPAITASEAWLSALPAAPEQVFTLYSRQSGNWEDPSTWSSTGHNGPTDGRMPTQGTRVLVGENHSISISENDARSGFLQIASGATLNTGTTVGHRLGVYQGTVGQQEGTLRISAATNQAEFPQGSWTAFLGNEGGTVVYENPSQAPNTFFRMPENIRQYHNLTLSFVAEGDDHRIWMPENSLSISGDMTLQDNREVIFNFNGGELRQYGDISVQGNVLFQGGAEWRMQSNGAHKLEVQGNWTQEGSWTVFAAEGGQVHDFYLHGDLTNNGILQAQTGIRFHFQGSRNATVAGAPFGTSGSEETAFRQILVDKADGSGVTFNDPKFTLEPLTWEDNPSPHAVAIKSGFIHFLQANQPSLLLSDASALYMLPANGGLSLQNIDAVISKADVELQGQLSISNQSFQIGGDLRYGGSQAPTIINSQSSLSIEGVFARLNGEQQAGIDYKQEGGQIQIGASLVDRLPTPTWEVTGAESQWSMSGGIIQVFHSNRDSFLPSLNFTPESSSFTGNERLEVGTAGEAGEQFLLKTTVALPSLFIQPNHQVSAQQELTLLRNLEIGNAAQLSMQDFTLEVGGDFRNDGIYRFGENITRFNGLGEQQLSGTLNFYQLEMKGSAKVQMNSNGRAASNAIFSSGLWDDGGFTLTVRGNLHNEAQAQSPNPTGGIRLLGESTQRISGEGVLGNLILDNAANIELLNDHRINGILNLQNGNLLIGAAELAFGPKANIIGGDEQHMLVTNGRATDAGITKEFAANQAIDFNWPIGNGKNFTPFTLKSDIPPSADGQVSVVHIAEQHPATDQSALALSQYWRVRSNGLSGATFFHQYRYGIEQIPNGLNSTNALAARLFDADWTTGEGAVGQADLVNRQILVQPNARAAGFINGDYTLGEASAFQEIPAYRSRGNGSWTSASTWQRRRNNGTWANATGFPVEGSIVTIRGSHQVAVPNAHTLLLTQLNIEAGGTLDLQSSGGHNVTELLGQGLLRLSTTRLPAGNLTNFTLSEGGTVAYDGPGDLPVQQKTYRSLILNADLQANGEEIRIFETLTLTPNARVSTQADWRLEGEMRNEGIFEASAGRVVFAGEKQVQELTGASLATFHELEARYGAGQLSLSGQVTINEALYLEGDTLLLNNSRLALNGELLGEGRLSGGAEAVLEIAGLGLTQGTLSFVEGQEQLQSFRLQRPDGQISLEGKLSVSDSLVLEAGAFQLNAAALQLDGPTRMGGGYFQADCQSQIRLSDTQGRFNASTTELSFNPAFTANIGVLDIERNGISALDGQLEVCKELALGNGQLQLSSNPSHFLRLLGDYRSTGGQWIGNAEANLYLENAGFQQDDLVFATTETAQLRDWTVDRSLTGAATAFSYQIAVGGDSLRVHGNLSLGAGSQLDLQGERTLRLFGIVTGEGELLGSNATNLELGGKGTSQGIVKFASGAQELADLRISRAGENANSQLGSNLTVHNRLLLDSGWLALANNRLTLIGQHERNKGALAGSAAAGLVIQTPASLVDTLVFTPWNSGQRLQVLQLEQQGLTVLGSALRITGLLSLQEGTLQLPDDPLQVFTLAGQHRRVVGLLRGNEQASLLVEGNGDAGDPLILEEGFRIFRNVTVNRAGLGVIALGTDLSIGEEERLEGRLSLLEGTLALNGNTLQFYSQANQLRRFGLGYLGADPQASLQLYGTGNLGDELAFAPQADTLGNLQILRSAGEMRLGSSLRVANDAQLEEPDYTLSLNGQRLHLNGIPRSTETVGRLAGQDTCAVQGSELIIGKGAFGYDTRPLGLLRFLSATAFSQIKIDNDHPEQNIAQVADGVSMSICDTLNVVQGHLGLGGQQGQVNAWWIGGDNDLDRRPDMEEGRQAYVFTSPTATLRGGRHTRMIINNGGRGIGDLGAPLHFAADADTLQELWVQRRLGERQLGQVRLGSTLHIGDSARYDGAFSLMGGEVVLNGQRLVLNLKRRGYQTLPQNPENRGLSLLRGDANAGLVLRSNRSINTEQTPIAFRWYAGNDTTLTDLNNIAGLREGLSLGDLVVELVDTVDINATAYFGSSLIVQDTLALLDGTMALPQVRSHANGDELTVRGRLLRPDPQPDFMADSLAGGYFRGGLDAKVRIEGSGAASLFFDDRSTALADAAAVEELLITRSDAPVRLRTELEVADGRFLLGDGVVLALAANAPDSLSPRYLSLGVPLSDQPGFRGVLAGNYRADLRLSGNIPYNRLRFAPNQNRLRSLELEGRSDRAVLQLVGSLTIGSPAGSENPAFGQGAENGRLALLNRGGLRLNAQELFLNIDSMQFKQTGSARLFADIASRLRITGSGPMGDPLMFDAEANILDEFTVSRSDTGQVLLGSNLQIGNASSVTGKLELAEGTLGLNNFTLTLYTPLIRSNGLFRGTVRSRLHIEGRGSVDPIAFQQDSVELYTLQELRINRSVDLAGAPIEVALGSRVRLGRGGVNDIGGLLLTENTRFAFGGQELQLIGDFTGPGLLVGDSQAGLSLVGEEGDLSQGLRFAEGHRELGMLRLDRVGDFNLETPLQLVGGSANDTSLWLNRGVLFTTEEAPLQMSAQAKVLGGTALASGASSDSYIQGIIEKAIDSSTILPFRFPLGRNGSVGSLGVAEARNQPLSVRATYFDTPHPQSAQSADNIFVLSNRNQFYLNRLSQEGWWQVSRSSEADSIRVLVPWESGAPSGVLSQVVAASFSTPGPKWQSLGQQSTLGDLSRGAVRSSRWLTENTAVALGARDITPENALPAYNLRFSAVYEEGEGIRLSWTTEGELESRGFVLRKAIADPNGLSVLADYNTDTSLRGKGSTLETSEYSYLDKQVDLRPGATHYYQLLQEHEDDRVTTYGIISVNLDASLDLATPFPNPARETVDFRFSLAREGNVALEVIGISGQFKQLIEEARLPRGTHQYTYNVRALPAGIYLVRLVFDNQVRVARMVVE